MKISTLGPKGTFSDVACEKYLRVNKIEADISYYNSISDSIEALTNKEVDVAIVPIENTLDGYVLQTLDHLFDDDIFIVDELKIKVNFKLVAHVTNKEDIKKIYVQFKAHGQCNKLLKDIGCNNVIITESNMTSFYNYLADEDSSAAIIPSHIEDDKAKLTINDVADIIDNHTRFVVIKRKADVKETPIEKDFVRIPIYVAPYIDHPGLLYGILKMFAKENINLSAIISRPTKKKLGTYNFYLEILASALSYDKVIESLGHIDEHYKIKIVGKC